MARPTPLSGFPEWLPAGRIVEQHVLATLQRTFELHGFAGIETRAVEPLDQLLRKGETSKEVYVLRRLQEDTEDVGRRGADAAGGRRAQLGLHFDLTVPFARYVLENAGHLAFPFKRYQIQKVWRGERPQDGRFREFVQADIDVVGAGDLPYHYEVELPLVIAEALGSLAAIGMPPVRILVNNRRVAEGFYRGLGLDRRRRRPAQHRQARQDRARRRRRRSSSPRPAPPRSRPPRASSSPRSPGPTPAWSTGCATSPSRHGVVSDLLDTGPGRARLPRSPPRGSAPRASSSPTSRSRAGLDYYTGSVYETVLVGHEWLGSICSGRPVRHPRVRRDDHLPGRRAVGRGLAAGVPPARRAGSSGRRARSRAPSSSR